MDTHGHVYHSPQPKTFEELSEWLQQSTFSLSTVWDVLNSHQVAMDNLHAAQMELNRTIEETHRLQSSQSVLLQVLEAEFEHFITDHWRPMQAVCYVQIPKESGRCRERKVGGSEARPADSY